jgi:RHS repeat-associated protein
MLTDANGSSTVKRYDYLPFGGELLAGINGRTAAMGYYSNPDSTNPKLTGQVRDSETYDPNGGTANDWFIARTFSGAQGRFQSVDPGNAGADPSNPQTWNAYAYVGNNPLSYVDPSGMQGISIFAPAGESSSAWSLLGPGAAAAFILYEAFFDNGPASHPLPTQPAGQGVTNNGNFGLRVSSIGASSGGSGDSPLLANALVIPGLTFFAQATGQSPREGLSSQRQPLRLYCQDNVIGAMGRAWQESANGQTGLEAGFAVNGSPNGPNGIRYSQSSRETGRTQIYIQPNTFAVFHVHPNTSLPWASQVDRQGANGTNAYKITYDMYTMSSQGLYVYHPGGPITSGRTAVRGGPGSQNSFLNPCQ